MKTPYPLQFAMRIPKNLNHGFTLIELLVVIAIISLLSSVILSALSSSRAKGADATVKSTLKNAQAQTELYYSNNSDSYTNICNNGASAGGVSGIYKFAVAAGAATGGTAVCNSSASAWAMSAPLKTTTQHWCVDYRGIPNLEAAALDPGITSCP